MSMMMTMMITMMITMMLMTMKTVNDELSPCKVEVFQVRHVGVDVLENTLVRGQVPQFATLQAQVSKALRKVVEGHFLGVDVTVMQLKRCQAWC